MANSIDLERCPPGLVCVPCTDSMPSAAVKSLLVIGEVLPDGSRVELHGGPHSIAAKRNRLVRVFLQHADLRWLLFLDSDIVAPPDLIPRLWATQQRIVSGVYFGRREPFAPEAGFVREGADFRELAEEWDQKPRKLRRISTFGGTDPLTEVDWTAGGCVLVRREVFEAIEGPWFVADKYGMSEDVRFCLKAKAAGFSVHVDTSLIVTHIGMLGIDYERAAMLMNAPSVVAKARARGMLSEDPDEETNVGTGEPRVSP